MAALGTLVKKAWSVRRFVVLLSAPLVLVPVLLSLPRKVPAPGHRQGRGGAGGSVDGDHRPWSAGPSWGCRPGVKTGDTEQGTPSGVH